MQHTYRELCKLYDVNYGEMCLVRDVNTGFLAVRRTIDKKMYTLYKKIQEINHSNLMKIFDVYMEGEECVIIAEYISGETLEECFRKQRHFTEEEVQKYIIMLCDGVQELHNHKIIHRDISANNVILTCDGGLKLCDYDISKIHDETRGVDEELRGTYGYAPPEQFGYDVTDEQTDVYAVGMIGYAMLGGNTGSMKCKSGRLRRAICRAISIDKKDRYKDVYQIKEEIEISAHDSSGLFVKFFKSIPGFRTGTIWHMIIALIFYPVLFYVDREGLRYCLKDFVTYVIYMVIPWILYLDLFNISKRILKLDSGQRWFRIVIGMAIQMAGYFFGGKVEWLI